MDKNSKPKMASSVRVPGVETFGPIRWQYFISKHSAQSLLRKKHLCQSKLGFGARLLEDSQLTSRPITV
jgi:hypothetical protein